ncbi:DUF4435 domain-containing protein [Trichormus sp. NMC-1]|uniref:DUF4435 domain-containing protein n=1 Tax=Trichormus sp. NMC-1 TaxID=1853259 RepID=UPI0008DBEC94|nr:DUF4435 domain-containing protein [Trichormus sp. NMC-1]
MSVVNSKVIFCEGTKDSLDSSLINKVIDNLLDKITIVPVGGKFSVDSKFDLPPFAKGYFSNNEANNQQYIIFRDRDFDVKPTDNIKLLTLGKRTFLTHRACIENYLLDANLIHAYWQARYAQTQENPNLKFEHGNSPGIDTISQWIENAARSLQHYQTVRWALGDLSQLPASRKQLATTWTGNSGKLPSSLALEDCKNEALGLIDEFQNAVGTVTTEKFETSLAEYQQQFSQEEFWTEKQYLIWFHGKDIQKEMQIQQPQYISLKNFFKTVLPPPGINSYPHLPNFIELHSDIMQLRNEIEQL